MLPPWRKRRFCRFLHFRRGGNVDFVVFLYFRRGGNVVFRVFCISAVAET